VRLQRDWTLAPDDRSLVAVSRSLERSQRAKQPADASQAETPPYAPPQTLPTDWEWAKEGAETVVRLDRRLRRVGLDYLETVEPLKALRREGKNAEALALMKAAVISAEMESAKKKFGVPSFYFLEAAKACRDLGDIGQECLFLHRCDVLAQRYGRRDPDVVKRLGKAAKLLAKQGR
ncbi:MAG TPA: hypothetical protein VJ598_09145, partial [Albitalea sp.]|nr:hypothetical protein [Albitalea sp.]